MDNLKKLTLLHSNDIHGDFFAEDVNSTSVGGISLLSGYINKVRAEEENTVYCIAGDMICGSIIDSEYHGLSTIDIINILKPDVATVGNHEIDYGIAHMLFMEKCADFPIINANLRIKNKKRLFTPYYKKSIGGINILFIGVITEDVLSKIGSGSLIDTFVDLNDAAEEIGKICDTQNKNDVDLTVLLTHIGIEKDKELAAALDPSWGVDIIIGGHSHTYIEKPEIVNNIPIVQAACGTDYVGRFDILVNTEENSIHSYQWKCVPITDTICETDEALNKLIEKYKSETDKIYSRCITRFRRQLTHPSRYCETEIGGLFADVFMDTVGVDIMLVASGSIRTKTLGPIVTYADLTECFPYDDAIHMIRITGSQFKRMVVHMMRDEVWEGDHCEFYQFSRGVHIVYDKSARMLKECSLNGEEIRDDMIYRVGLQDFHYRNLESFLNLSYEEVEQNGHSKILSTSARVILEEYLSTHLYMEHYVSDRVVVLN